MQMHYSSAFGGSNSNPPPIPGKYVNWPDARLKATPPPPPPKPLYSLAYPLIARPAGKASVA